MKPSKFEPGPRGKMLDDQTPVLPDAVDVLQRHRDAAADIVRSGAPGISNGNSVIASEIKGGLHDNYAVVQAFAASEARLIARLSEPDIYAACEKAWMNRNLANPASEPLRDMLAAVSDALKKGE